jgi:hypothetical protein
MLDSVVAELYLVPPKSLNLAVRRSLDRFPADFMFQLTKDETAALRFQIETPNKQVAKCRWRRDSPSRNSEILPVLPP